MKQINFIVASAGGDNNELSLLLKTAKGYLYAIHIDQFSRRMQDLYKTAEPEIISYVPGDKPLIEVTQRGATLLCRAFKCQKKSIPLTLVNTNCHGRNWYAFHTAEELSSGTIQIIN